MTRKQDIHDINMLRITKNFTDEFVASLENEYLKESVGRIVQGAIYKYFALRMVDDVDPATTVCLYDLELDMIRKYFNGVHTVDSQLAEALKNLRNKN